MTEQEPELEEPELQEFELEERAESIGYALDGIRVLIRNEQNAWIHAGATVSVLIAGFLLQISRGEWIALVLAMTAVWMGESLNTAIESIVDQTVDGKEPLAKVAKDTAAGAVLLAAIGAVLVGLLVFIPPLIELIWP